MIKIVFKYALIFIVFLFGLLLLGVGLASIGIDGWKSIDSTWNNFGIYVSAATYGLYAYVAFNWRDSCHWLANKVTEGEKAEQLGNSLVEKKTLAISIVLFVELISLMSRYNL